MFLDAIYLVFLVASTFLFQIVGMGILFSFFKKNEITSELWAWGRIVSWLSIGLILWFLSHLVGVNTDLGFWSVFTGLLFYLFFRKSKGKVNLKTQLKEFIQKNKKEIFMYEFVFLLGFLFLGLMRTYNPHVLDLEKFMDAGLMQRYITSPTLPIEDMWLAGEKINYYTFGHFLGSLMLRFWHVSVEFGYNFLLAYILGLMCIESFALSRVLLRPFLTNKKNRNILLAFVGLLTLLLVNFGGNSHPLWYLLKNKSFEKYWYPDATRFIERTIHEFPAYSYIVSDIHAHVWGLPIVLLMLFFSWQWMQSIVKAKKLKEITFKKIISTQWFKEAVVLGGILGILAMTSTWDMMIYGLFLGILGLLLLVNFTEKINLFILSGAGAVVTAAGVVSLWLLNFTSISQGVFSVYERSPFWQLLVLWGGHFSLSLLSIFLVYHFFFRKKKKAYEFLFLVSMSIIAFILLLLPEVIYFKDIYPNHPRANTMFKFTFQAFIFMSFLVVWGLGFLLQKKHLKKIALYIKIPLLIIFFGFITTTLTYPFLAYPSYYGHFKTRDGWNGLSWMIKEFPDDYQAIMWLRRQNFKDSVILEAVGESYTKKARVSTFTGIPTVLGWRVHEWLWRGGFSIPGQRTTEVKIMYEKPLSLEAQNLFDRYKVKYVFVGSQEKKTYTLDIENILELGTVIYSEGGTFIIKLEDNQ
ncbi:MAG: hypothetical protein HN981_00880 [Candidatus Pacebacteria bacterium]|jgi:uncharacterized membrane protein|nr:hypothetical protein [Candidatus Paceibacterota bacterium]MBT6756594.1 hypothetical protein [Candidatus Paceibacterota bacterium]MBT6920933.1 hypothetical protein [Candidatus Paceibacterota bacterium]